MNHSIRISLAESSQIESFSFSHFFFDDSAITDELQRKKKGNRWDRTLIIRISIKQSKFLTIYYPAARTYGWNRCSPGDLERPSFSGLCIPRAYCSSRFLRSVLTCGWWTGHSSLVTAAIRLSLSLGNPVSPARSDCQCFVFVDVTSIFQTWRGNK